MAVSLGNADVVLATTASAIVSAPSATQIAITKASVCNTDSSGRTVSVYRVPPSGVSGPKNEIIKALSIAAGKTIVLPISGLTLVNGQSLQAVADTGALVNLNVSYVQEA